MNENETKLASEIIHEQKVANKRMFIILMVVLTMFFVSNLAWLVAWNLPDSKTVQSYEMAGEDNANVVSRATVDVPRGCCFTVSIEPVNGTVNDPATTPTPLINIIDGSVSIRRTA
jgi:hypothetical protein